MRILRHLLCETNSSILDFVVNTTDMWSKHKLIQIIWALLLIQVMNKELNKMH